jgi:4-hydroxybenzoate polyprenyltransferase
LLRIHHWVKNVLLVVPYLTAQAWGHAGALRGLLLGMLSLSLVASATYILNDLADLRHDQAHSAKKNRPLASGVIGITPALIMTAVLASAGLMLALQVAQSFAVVILTYTVLTTIYTRAVKRVALLDVLVLATLWVLRLIAGAAAIGVELSMWLLSFGGFLFLSLSLAKRAAELEAYHGPAERLLPGRGYARRDLSTVLGFGMATATVSVLVLALFVDSSAAQLEYRHPQWLWLLCPPLWFWLARLWLITARGEMHHDPIEHSLRDRASWASLIVMASIWIAAQALW